MFCVLSNIESIWISFAFQVLRAIYELAVLWLHFLLVLREREQRLGFLMFFFGELSCKKERWENNNKKLRNATTRLRRWWSEYDETAYELVTTSLGLYDILIYKMCNPQNFAQFFLFPFATKTRVACFHSCRLPPAGCRCSIQTQLCIVRRCLFLTEKKTKLLPTWTQLFRQILFPF